VPDADLMDIETLLALWDAPPDTRPDPEKDFAAVYADPVQVNSTMLTVAELVDRARTLHATFTAHEREVLEVVEAPGRLVVAFRLSADHTGPWPTAAGLLEPTGTRFTASVIDILTVKDGLITEIVMVTDQLEQALRARHGQATG
jgi:hypothetical protein